MDNQINKLKHMKFDKLKSKVDEFSGEINNLSIIETSISELDKKIDDSRYILSELERNNHKMSTELISKQQHYDNQRRKYEEYNKDSELIEKKIKDLEPQIELQKLQNLSYEEHIENHKIQLIGKRCPKGYRRHPKTKKCTVMSGPEKGKEIDSV